MCAGSIARSCFMSPCLFTRILSALCIHDTYIHTYIHTYTRYDLSLCLWSLHSQQYAGASSALTLSLRGNSASALQQLFLPPRGACPNNHSELGQGTTIVAHCITPTGRSSAKMLFLQRVGLWNDSAITLHNYAEDIPQIQ